MTALPGQIRRMGLAVAPETRRSDAELLHRYIHDRHELSFAVLVRRHSGTVLAICKRMLGHRHDAEDATQAVFIVLMRRAETVRAETLGQWLHGVAVRVCLKARAVTARRHCDALENEPIAKESPSTEPDVATILDEELATLPSKYRSAMVECDVLERSRSEAAKVLGWPEGTVAARLLKARQLMADKLRRRGVTLSVTALSLLASTNRLSAKPTPWDVPSTMAQILAQGVLRTMSYSNLIWRSVAVLLAFGTIGTVVMLAPATDKPVTVSDSPVSVAIAPVPKPVPVIWEEREPVRLNGWLAGSLSFSADGKILLAGGTNGHVIFFELDSNTVITTNQKEYNDFQGNVAVAFATKGMGHAITGMNRECYFRDYQILSQNNDHKKLVAQNLEANRVTLHVEGQPFSVGIFADEMVTNQATVNGIVSGISRRLVSASSTGYYTANWIANQPITLNVALIFSGSLWLDPRRTLEVRMTNKKFDEYVNPLPFAIDPKGKRIVCLGPIDEKTNRNVLWAWTAGKGTDHKLMKGQTATVVCAAWSSDGNTIVTGDDEGTVIVWDAKTFKETKRFTIGEDRICSVDVTADGKRIAAAVTAKGAVLQAEDARLYNEKVYVWNVDDSANPSKPIAPPEKHSGHFGFLGVASVKFTPDGKTLAATFCDYQNLNTKKEIIGQIRIWDLKPKQ